MIEKTIASIESRLYNVKGLSEEQRLELQALIVKLKAELALLEQRDPDQARSIAGYVDLSTHEITRGEKHPQLLRHTIDGLSASVIGMEIQHPRLTEVVNTFCAALANAGI